MSKNSLLYWNKWQMSDTNKNYELQPLQNEGMYPKYSFSVHIIFLASLLHFETICTIDKTNAPEICFSKPWYSKQNPAPIKIY